MYPALADAADRISAALTAVPGVRYYRQLGGAIDPPATVLPPPRLAWNGPTSEPTDATWTVGLIVDRTDRTVEQLESLLQPVVEALDGLDDVVVTTAEMGSYPAGGVELPAYLITLEVAL
jgi:hypothetical protein